MPYTLAQAAAAVGRNRSTLLRGIKSGRISAIRDELTGAWLIEPAELHRIYANSDAQGTAPVNGEARISTYPTDLRSNWRLNAPVRPGWRPGSTISMLRSKIYAAGSTRRPRKGGQHRHKSQRC